MHVYPRNNGCGSSWGMQITTKSNTNLAAHTPHKMLIFVGDIVEALKRTRDSYDRVHIIRRNHSLQRLIPAILKVIQGV